MAQLNWVHNQSRVCFIVVHELHRRARGSDKKVHHQFIFLHELQREFTINHELA
jgi:hypothetical protein